MERAKEKQKDMYMFHRSGKGINTVKHILLVNVLLRFGVGEKDIRVITRLYAERNRSVRVGDQSSDWIEMKQ